VKIRIEQDEHYESPREWDNLGRMVCLHRRYNLGDKHSYSESSFDSWAELREELVKEEKAVVILPLFLFDHSGISISCRSSTFRAVDSAGWDWGQVGFIYATREDVLQTWSRKYITKKLLAKVEEILVGEVKTYDQCLTGDVWGYIIEDDDGEHLDSCWGFYGHEYCEQEAQRALEYLKQKQKEDAVALKQAQSAMPCCHP
jgi:hypothetical protein